VIGIWTLAIYTSYTLKSDMEHALGEQQFSTVSIIAEEINTELSDRMRVLEQVAKLVSPAMMGNAASMQTFIEVRPSLSMMFNGGVYVLLADGTAIADFPLSTGRRGLNFKERKYTIGALKEGKTTIGRPLVGKALRSTIFSIATPIHDPEGKVIGALAGTVDLAKPNFISRSTDNSYGKTGGYLLISPKIRTIVYATDKKLIMELLPPPGDNLLIDRYTEGYEGTGITLRPNDGVEVLTSAKNIPVAGWYLMALMPTEEAFSPINALQKRGLLAAIFLTLLAGGLTWWILTRQLAPIFTTMETLAALSDSDQPLQPLPITRQDEIGGMIGSFNHLLETLRHREETLRKSEEKHRLLFESADDAILIHDTVGHFLSVNPLACKRFGYSHAELISLPIGKLVSPEQSRYIPERIAQLLEHGNLLFETEHQLKDGSSVPTEVNARLITWDGQPAIISICRDITERKRAEQEKANLETQLHQAQKMESVGRLAGGVAHDFNNMLTVILGYAQLGLMNLDPTHPVSADLSEIIKAAKRSADLTRQMLAFARKQTIAPKVLDLNEAVSGMLKMLQRLIGEEINLNWHPSTKLWQVHMDPSQIDQILANLCVNARDAIAGDGKITIETTNSAFDREYCDANAGFIPGEFVLLAVSDDGCGMDKETEAQIFEPFFTTKAFGEGTGLGLATVYGIVKQNNGFINVYSEPGLGTTFKIYLPRHENGEGRDLEEVSEPLPTNGQETILLVEDEAGILNVTKALLEKYGYTVLAASKPSEAIALAEKYDGEISLLMTDVVMPVMNGRELSNRLSVLRPQLKCLFMSGYTADVIANHGVLDNGVKWIPKPFSAKELATKVREVLGGQ
jgi:PAS domain S-box-containing protein